MTAPVLALCGGVGGAKLALGLERLLGDDLLIAVNTGDDFEHLGLKVCPDIDTVTYTLAGIVNTSTGWGRDNESGHCMEALQQFGGEDWFFLGDRDLALHLERSRLLKQGDSLSEVTQRFAQMLGIKAQLLPMCDQPAPTTVLTERGSLPFQHYFVRERCEPVVQGLQYGGAKSTSHTLLQEIITSGVDGFPVRAIVICPSNPYLSIDPLLILPGIRQSLVETDVPVIAVSPIVGGEALKGPTAKIMMEMGLEVSSASIAAHYRDFLDCLVIDHGDYGECKAIAEHVPHVELAATMMNSDADKDALARRVLEIAETLNQRK